VELDTGSGDQVTVEGGSATLGRTLVVSGSGRLGRVRGGPLRVTVPSWARVELTNLGGPVTVARAPEHLEVTAINGDVTVHGGSGTVSLTTVNGRIAVRDFNGRRLEVEAMTGEVDIDGAVGAVVVNTINDGITLRNIRSSSVEAGSVNGEIQWTGALAGDGRYHFEAHNGSVILRVPQALDARLHVITVMGDFNTQIQGTVHGDARRSGFGFEPRDFTVTFGRGSARVEVETFNGGIHVLKMGGS
jgi:DUF4097 and DUF4098 domain-containing protein YvlB